LQRGAACFQRGKVLPVIRSASHGKEGGGDRLITQTTGAFLQGIAAFKAQHFMQQGQALSGKDEALAHAAVGKAFVGGRATKADHFPADAGAGIVQLHRCAHFGSRAVIDDGFTRQPFQHAARNVQVCGLALGDVMRIRSVEFGGRRRGEQGVRALRKPHGKAQIVAAHKAARRVQQAAMAGLGCLRPARRIGGRGFGIEGPLHAQRPAELHFCQRGAPLPHRKIQLHARAPAAVRRKAVTVEIAGRACGVGRHAVPFVPVAGIRRSERL